MSSSSQKQQNNNSNNKEKDNQKTTTSNQLILELNKLLKQLQQQQSAGSNKSSNNNNINNINNRQQHFTKTLSSIDQILSQLLITITIQSDNNNTGIIIINNNKPQQLIFDTLKPLTRQVTNFYPREIHTLEKMKSTIYRIVQVYMAMFTQYHLPSVLQIVKELLQRENILFVKSYKNGGAGAKQAAGVGVSEVQKMLSSQENTFSMEEQEKKYNWSRGRLGYTTFHRDCCEIVFGCIHQLPVKQYSKMSLQQIKQLMNFMLYFEDYIYQQKLQQFIQQSYTQLQSILLSPTTITNTSLLTKQVTKQLFQQLQQKMLKLLFYSTNKQLKQSILLLGPQFAYNYFANSQTIEKKLFAMKILQKFANHYYYRGVDVMKDDLFADWLLGKGLWDVLVNKNSQVAIVKCAEYILKLIVNKRTNKILTQQKFKHFLHLIWQAQQEVRKCYIKSLDPLKLSYSNISLLIDSLKHIQENGQLYIEEFFYLLQQICRYGSDTQRKATVEILMNVMKRHYLNWKSYSIQRKAMDSLKYCFEKLADGVKDTTQRGEMYVQLINQFILTPNYLTLTISRKLFQSQQKKNSYALEKAARILVQKKHIIQTIIELMSSHVPYSQQLLYFLKAILQKYKSYNCTLTLSLPQEIMLKATRYPQIFSQLITFTSPKDCEPLLEKLIQLCYSSQCLDKDNKDKEINDNDIKNKQTTFESIKQLFYKVNYLFVKTIQPEYFRKKQHKIKINPQELYFVKDLQLLLVACEDSNVQQQCAQLLAEVFTSFSEGYMEKGKIKTKQFMCQLVRRLEGIDMSGQQQQNDNNIIEGKQKQHQQSFTQIYGLLCLLKQLLYATEIHGVGEQQLKPHNALITTSLIKVKIWNNAAYGDDVQKCYQKSVPSNMLLFELLTELSEKFKCGQHELYLQEGSNVGLPAKYNGRTLLELGFDYYRQFSAYKNTKVQIQRQPLKLSNNQLNPLFTKIIKQIFSKYSINNKMGEQQIINYIRGVTNSPSHSRDSRVVTLLKQYDLDKDGCLTIEDLVRFYSDSCDGGDRENNIWTNIQSLHYRKDLRRFDELVGPVRKEELFRYYVKESHKIYQLLFNICHLRQQQQQKDDNLNNNMNNNNKTITQLTQLAKSILGHLPTCESLIANFDQPLQLQNKSIFEISYVLINVRYYLEKEEKQRQRQRQKKQAKCEEQQQQQKQQKQQQCRIEQQSQNDLKQQHHLKPHPNHHPNSHPNRSYIQKFITNKNDLTLLNLIQSLTNTPNKSQQQKVLIAVSLNILRLLTSLPSLSIDYLMTDKYQYHSLEQIVNNQNQLNLESYLFFLQLVENSITEGNVAILQSALALLLNQKQLKWQQWMYDGLFHQQAEIRKLVLNFLVFYSVQYQFPIDFFDIKNIDINRNRCQQWFLLMLLFVSYKKSVSITVLESVVERLETEYEEISTDGCYNPILNGNLSLLAVLIRLSPTFVLAQRTKLYNLVKNVMSRTLSNQNRLIGYQLMVSLDPKGTLKYMYKLIKLIKPTQKYQIKQNFVGIKNLGSTCYMNSILQQFFTIEKFKKMVLTFPLKEIPSKTLVNQTQIVDDFLYQLQKMYSYLQWSKKKYYIPRQFCLTIKDYTKKPINTSIQQDAHEFLNNLFDKIQTYMKPASLLPTLQRIFQGKTVCEIACGQCESKKSKVQDFYHLALEVKNVNTLEESFKKFISPQTIEDYYCQKCEKKSMQITKQTLLNELPEVLIVNLQRIVFDLETFTKVKVHSRLEFPVQLSLKEYLHGESGCFMQNKCQYKLKGVVIHSGTSQGGHYYSLIKVNKQWYKFNDETVSRFNISQLQKQAYGGNSDGWGDSEFSTNAYILFYQRVSRQSEEQIVTKEGQKLKLQSVQKKQRSASMMVEQEEQHQQQDEQNLDKKMSEQPNQQQSQQQQQLGAQRPKIQMAMQQQQQKEQQINHQHKQQQNHQQFLFHPQVTHQNKLFYYQLQLHQQSYFTFITTLYQSIRPKQILQLSQQLGYYKQYKQINGLDTYQLVMDIFVQIIKFIKVYSQLGNKVINDIGTAVYELMTLLPQKACQLLTINNNNKNTQNQNSDDNIKQQQQQHKDNSIHCKQWIQTICTHSEISIRELYKVILNKCIYVYVRYKHWRCSANSDTVSDGDEVNKKDDDEMVQQQQEQQQLLLQQQQQKQQKQKKQTQDPLTQLLKQFLHQSTLQTINKNIYKSFYFFEFWWVNIQFNPQIQQFCLKNNYLEILLDLLMGSEGVVGNNSSGNKSNNNGKEKKRQDLPYEMVGPLMQSVVRLLNRKKNTANAIPFKMTQKLNNQQQQQQQYYPLTKKQQTILTSPSFYKRMIRLKYDNGLLSQIVNFMCYQNQQFSANICQLFLIGLNNIDEIENSLSLLNNIKSYLLIDDRLKQDRVRWMLGVPQFDHATKMSYGLRHSNQSSNIVYVSSRFFIGDEKYRPALQVLHDKRCYFSDFEVHGIMTLLEILLNNQFALRHVLSIPPPSYLYRHYLSWVEQYSIKLSTQDHYGLTMDKKILAQSLQNLLKQVLAKIQTVNGLPKMPILPKIIGTNTNLFIEQEIQNQFYTIKKWVHETYVIDNLPLQSSSQKGNLSLPDQLFGIKQPKSYAKYFIQNNDIKQPCDIEIPTQRTVNTLEIQTKKALKLTFMMPSFDYQIYINKGTMFVNYCYSDFPLQAYLEVEIRDDEGDKCNKDGGGEQNGENMIQMKSMSKNDKDNNYGNNKNNSMEIEDTYGPSTDPNAKKDYEFDTGYGNVADVAGYGATNNDNGFDIPCQVCTYLNYPGRTRCEMCDTPL